MFESKVLKCVVKMNSPISTPFALFIINTRILSNFWNEWSIFEKEKGHLKKIKIIHPKVLNVLLLLKHHQFASNFEQ
jgi:hypothetical protein